MPWFTPGPRGSCLHGLAQPLWPQHPCSMEQVEQVHPAGFSPSSPLRQCSSLCMIGKVKLLTALQGPSWLDSCPALSFPCITPPAPPTPPVGLACVVSYLGRSFHFGLHK